MNNLYSLILERLNIEVWELSFPVLKKAWRCKFAGIE